MAVPANEVGLQVAVIHKALSGIGTKETDLINILARQSVARRQAICDAYRAAYKMDLLAALKSDTSGDFWNILKALCRSPEENDAKTLHKAVKGLGTDEKAILEIFCTRTNEELNKTANIYFSLFRTTLMSALKKDTSGDFLEVLLALLSAVRDESGKVDPVQAKLDAEALYKAGPKTWGTDVKTYTGIFAKRSYAQLREVFEQYQRVAKTDIQTTIKQEMSGDLALSFSTMVHIIQNKEDYFAERLHKAMKGLGTSDTALIRIFVSRKEKDLQRISAAFYHLFGKSLEKAIADETSSDFKATLLAILESAAPV